MLDLKNPVYKKTEIETVKQTKKVRESEITTKDLNELLSVKMTECREKERMEKELKRANEEIFSLSLNYDRLRTQSKLEMDKLKHENESLKSYMNQLKEKHAVELKDNKNTINDLKSQLKALKEKLKQEEEQIEQIKVRLEGELNSAKVRYENELNKQNNLMQRKYDNFVCEINKLHENIRELKTQKDELVYRKKSTQQTEVTSILKRYTSSY
jgi:chromosome segregation ATPase